MFAWLETCGHFIQCIHQGNYTAYCTYVCALKWHHPISQCTGCGRHVKMLLMLLGVCCSLTLDSRLKALLVWVSWKPKCPKQREVVGLISLSAQAVGWCQCTLPHHHLWFTSLWHFSTLPWWVVNRCDPNWLWMPELYSVESAAPSLLTAAVEGNYILTKNMSRVTSRVRSPLHTPSFQWPQLLPSSLEWQDTDNRPNTA